MSRLVIYLCLVLIYLTAALEIVPERFYVEFINPKYVAAMTGNVRRYKRRGLYYFNLNVTTNHLWNNNVTIQFKVYEYLHNEYRESFIDSTFKLCQFTQLTRPYIGNVMDRVGFKCPLPPAKYIVYNITTSEVPAIEHLPYKFPVEKFKLLIRHRVVATQEIMAEEYLIARVEKNYKYSG